MSQFGISNAANALALELKDNHLSSVVEVQRTAAQSARSMPTQEALQTAARLKVLLGATGKIVVVSGIADNDPATDLAGSLGGGLATMTESPVLIVDANVRAPRMHEIYGVPQDPGLLNVLDRELPLDRAVYRLELSNLLVMPLGDSRSSLPALLSKPEAHDAIERIRERFRFVVISTGLVAAGADGVLLASISDGVVAAVAAGVRRRHEVVQFHEELKRLKIPLLGVVLTKSK